jgi:recA bacterial DNA recombination protein
MPLARADLETLLRARHLDRTLTTALPAPEPDPEYACGPTGVPALDARLGGGFPRGQLSEIAGGRSSGRFSLLVSMMAAATARGELVALVDALDMLDVESAAGAGVDLDRLLWIRGHVVSNPGLCRDMNQRALEQAIRALALVLQAGNFGLVAFDAGEAPAGALNRLPFTTWLRLQRMLEGTQTVCVLIGPAPMARSSAGLTVQLGQVGRDRQMGQERQEGQERLRPRRGEDTNFRAEASAKSRAGGGAPAQVEKKLITDSVRFSDRLFKGLDTEARVIRARARGFDDVRVCVSTAAC